MSLAEKREFDVIIVGGGVIGLSIARELRKAGVERTAIIEKNQACGTEASNAAAGMLAPQAEADEANNFFDFCRQSRDLYPNFANELRAESNVDIELDQTGTLYLAIYESDLAALEQRFAWQKAAGLPIEKLTKQAVLELEPNINPNICGALRFPLDWQVENRKLVFALEKSSNAAQFCGQNVTEIANPTGKVWTIKTDSDVFFAEKIVIASGAWTSLIDFGANLRIKPIRGQIMSFRAAAPLFRHVIYTARGYLVPRRDQRILIGATVEDVGFERQTGSAAKNYLLETLDEIRLQSTEMVFQDHWLGFRPKTPDGLPLVGEYPENSGLFFATGHYRNGILLAPVTAKIIADKIVKNIDSPFLKIFNLSRFINKI